MAEGIGAGERISASQSRGHWWGLSGWGGSTRRRDACGGVKAVEQGLEWVVHGSLATTSKAMLRAA
jgi:hypothetical protein